jgi:Nucleotidyl transferase AbiEii toxin, Type IV TA system
MTGLVGVIAAAAEVQAFCQSRGWRFCFIGGIAVQRWGMPRFTQDVDVTLLTGLGSEPPFVDALLQQFSGRLKDTRQFALERRVLLARTSAGIPLDFALGALPFEETSIERATSWLVSQGISLTTCSAEDPLVHKVFAARDRDWSDVETILTRQHDSLNLGQVRRDLRPLLELKGDSEPLDKLERMIAAIDSRLAR